MEDFSMKKVSFGALLIICSFLLITTFFSCSNPSDSGVSNTKTSVFDFRIKDETERSQANISRSLGGTKIYETSEPFLVDPNKPIQLTSDEQKSIFKLEALSETNSKKGIKVTLTPPSSPNAYITGINIWYIDGNENYSTKTYSNRLPGDIYYFPFVLPNKRVIIAIEAQFLNKGEFQARYAIDTKTGIGTIDDLPKDYDSEKSHIAINNLAASIKNVIPPDLNVHGLKRLQKHCAFQYTMGEPRYLNWIWIGANETLINAMDECYDLDFSNLHDTSRVGSYKYYFLYVAYKFEVEGYDNQQFFTPAVESKLVEISSIRP